MFGNNQILTLVCCIFRYLCLFSHTTYIHMCIHDIHVCLLRQIAKLPKMLTVAVIGIMAVLHSVKIGHILCYEWLAVATIKRWLLLSFVVGNAPPRGFLPLGGAKHKWNYLLCTPLVAGVALAQSLVKNTHAYVCMCEYIDVCFLWFFVKIFRFLLFFEVSSLISPLL